LPAEELESPPEIAQGGGTRDALPMKRAITCLEPEVPASIVLPGNSDSYNYPE
jgi:hypothetical protein